MHWQVQEAKQRFSELLREAETGEPQIVTKHGEEIAVVIDIAEFRRLRGQVLNIMEYLRVDPLVEVDLPVERPADQPRDVDLTD
jgi:prevent-host-death family protein